MRCGHFFVAGRDNACRVWLLRGGGLWAGLFMRWKLHVIGTIDDFDNPSDADGATVFANGEMHVLLQRNRAGELDGHLGVVAGHDLLDALGETDVSRHVRGADVELRTVAGEERFVGASFVPGEDVDQGLKTQCEE